MPIESSVYEDPLEKIDPNDPLRQIVAGQSVPRFLGRGHAILGTRQIDMPIQNQFPEETQGGVAVAMPDSQTAASEVPRFQPNPAGGPLGFRSFPDYLNAFDEARREAIQQQAEEKHFQETTQQGVGIENHLKAIKEARKFIATRRMGSLIQSGIRSGLPPEQAFVNALIHTPDVMADNIAATGSALGRAAYNRRPTPNLGGVSVVYDPITKVRRGLAFRGGEKSSSFISDLNDAPTATSRITNFGRAVEILQQRVRNAEDMEDPALPDLQKQLNSTMEQYLRMVGAGQKAEPDGGPAPVAPPVPAPAQARRYDPKTGRLEPRP